MEAILIIVMLALLIRIRRKRHKQQHNPDDLEARKKQDADLISVIIPTINNDN